MYKIHSLVMNGIKIEKINLLDSKTSKLIAYTIESLMTDIKEKRIEVDSVEYIELDGKGYLHNLNLNQLPVYSKFKLEIIDKISDKNNNNTVIGYIVKNKEDNKESKISADKCWSLIASNCIENANAYFSKDSAGDGICKYIKCSLN